jgi:hypothetical protein
MTKSHGLITVPLILSPYNNPETCDSTERRLFFKNKGYCRAAIVSTLPGSTM